MTDKEAIILLNTISGIGAIKIQSLMDFWKPAEIFNQSAGKLSQINGISSKIAKNILDTLDTDALEKELDIINRGGVEVVTKLDEEYPERLKEIYDSPPCLYVRGNVSVLKTPMLAIVGSRRISSYGRRMAQHLSEAAGYAGWTVVSGLAYGTDGIAHQGALDAQGKTIAVLGGGLARIHPQDHIPLAREIVKEGAVISEFPMTMSPNRHSFPMRNRVISGLSNGVLVIEAGIRSGSLITANFANEQGRTVFAIPGQVDNPSARGCNSLIKDGAKLTENFNDILEEFEFLPGFENYASRKQNKQQEEQELDFSAFSDVEQKICDALKVESLTIDGLVATTKLDLVEIMSTSMQLELKKILTKDNTGKYILSDYTSK